MFFYVKIYLYIYIRIYIYVRVTDNNKKTREKKEEEEEKKKVKSTAKICKQILKLSLANLRRKSIVTTKINQLFVSCLLFSTLMSFSLSLFVSRSFLILFSSSIYLSIYQVQNPCSSILDDDAFSHIENFVVVFIDRGQNLVYSSIFSHQFCLILCMCLYKRRSVKVIIIIIINTTSNDNNNDDDRTYLSLSLSRARARFRFFLSLRYSDEKKQQETMQVNQ